MTECIDKDKQVEELYFYAKRCADDLMPDEAAVLAMAAERIEELETRWQKIEAARDIISGALEQATEFVGMINFHTENETAIHYIDCARSQCEKALEAVGVKNAKRTG